MISPTKRFSQRVQAVPTELGDMQIKMRFLLAFLLLFQSFTFSEDSLPSTVEEAANLLIRDLPEEDKLEVVTKRKDDLIMYHHGWGTSIRNSFGLWGGNKKLLKDCGGPKTHPDDCSMIIIEEVWKILRSSMPEERIAEIDFIHEALDKIQIPSYEAKNSGAIEFVDFLNTQISKSDVYSSITIRAKCTSEHYRLKNFQSHEPQSLRRALFYFEGQYLARISFEGTVIVLTPSPFLDSKKCEE